MFLLVAAGVISAAAGFEPACDHVAFLVKIIASSGCLLKAGADSARTGRGSRIHEIIEPVDIDDPCQDLSFPHSSFDIAGKPGFSFGSEKTGLHIAFGIKIVVFAVLFYKTGLVLSV